MHTYLHYYVMQKLELQLTCLQINDKLWRQEWSVSRMLLPPSQPTPWKLLLSMCLPKKQNHALRAWKSHCRKSLAKWNPKEYTQMPQTMPWYLQRKVALLQLLSPRLPIATGRSISAPHSESKTDSSLGLRIYFQILRWWVASKPAEHITLLVSRIGKQNTCTTRKQIIINAGGHNIKFCCKKHFIVTNSIDSFVTKFKFAKE